MRNLKINVIGMLLIAALFSLSTNAFGQRGSGMGQGRGQGQGYGQGRGNGQGFCNNIPNLTTEQQTKIDKFRTAHLKEMQGNRNVIGEKKAHLQTLRCADKADMTAINKTIDEMAVIKVTMAKQHEQHLQDVRNILDTDQKIYFDNFRNSRGKGNGHGCGHGRGQGRGNGSGRGNGQGGRY